MIGDLVIDGRLTFSKLGVNLDAGALGIKIGVKGKYGQEGRAGATTSNATLPLGNVGTIGYLGIVNLGAPLVDTPAAPTVTPVGTAGAVTYAYKIVARQADGAYTVASAQGSTSTGNATLSSINLNRITWTQVPDATGYDIYRVTGAATQGLIGTAVGGGTFDDTGIAGVGGAAAAPSTTPYDYTLLFGADGTNYPIRAKGGDVLIVRWNAAAINFKASVNPTDFDFLIIEE